MAHAILSPSSASRWLACTRSARYEEQFPDKSSQFAEEGTLAHKIGELMIRMALGQMDPPAVHEYNGCINHPMYSEAMHEYCDDYATFVIEKFNEAKKKTPDAQLYLERRLDMTAYIPDGFGTSDVVIIADGMMTTIDLKYGKGVAVNVEENKQQMLYALGALTEFDHLYDIKEVRMIVYQPRIGNIAEWTIKAKELLKWAKSYLKPRAEMAFKGEGEYLPGDHCLFCKGKATCKALAEYNLQIMQHEFADPNTLTDEAIADILQQSSRIASWLTAVDDYALDQAVNHGKKWPAHKLVEGRSNRTFTDQAKVAEVLGGEGFAEGIIYTKKLNGITALEKAVGKAKFGELLGEYIIKPAGKPTLVHESDKRPELNSLAAAQEEFAHIE